MGIIACPSLQSACGHYQNIWRVVFCCRACARLFPPSVEMPLNARLGRNTCGLRESHPIKVTRTAGTLLQESIHWDWLTQTNGQKDGPTVHLSMFWREFTSMHTHVYKG